MDRYWPLLLVLLAPTACSQSSESKLEIICKRYARIDVYDQSAWRQYIAKVQAQDLEDQRGVLAGQGSGAIVAPRDTNRWIRPFPYVAKYSWENDKPRFSGEPMPSATPEANDITVLQNGHPIARLRNFDVLQWGFGYSPIYSCSSRFPEVYRIPRGKVLS